MGGYHPDGSDAMIELSRLELWLGIPSPFEFLAVRLAVFLILYVSKSLTIKLTTDHRSP